MAASHINPTGNAITRFALTNGANQFFEHAEYISARKKLIHSMSLNTDRLINRATVVGCAISATPNYLKLHMPRTLLISH